jgi:hypothetical protein
LDGGYNFISLVFGSNGSIGAATSGYGDTYIGPSVYCTPIASGVGSDYEMRVTTSLLEPAGTAGGFSIGGVFYNNVNAAITPWLPLTSGLDLTFFSPNKFQTTSVQGLLLVRKKSTQEIISRYYNVVISGYDY